MIINHNCCVKLVPLVTFIYDARSLIHPIRIVVDPKEAVVPSHWTIRVYLCLLTTNLHLYLFIGSGFDLIRDDV